MKFVSTRLMGASVVLAALLAGCGGGNDSTATGGTTADAADKYIGTWARCEPSSSTTYTGEVVTIGKVNANTVTVRLVLKTHATANCSDAGTTEEDSTARATIVGTTTTAASQPAEQVDVELTASAICNVSDCGTVGDTGKWITFANATQLQVGFGDAAYPTSFDDTFTKR